jgi:pimeloyl-ACP methyl ester carboxylesterase
LAAGGFPPANLPPSRFALFTPAAFFLPFFPFFLLPILLFPLLQSCVPASQNSRALLREAEAVAAGGRLAPYTLRGGGFTLAAFARSGPGETLVVYIEGDGRAWASRSRPSEDPTPRDPLTLRLAARDPAPKVLYLARPCQYMAGEQAAGACDESLWTSARYGRAVLAALSQAVDEAKAGLSATRVSLVGYSGGGALALLLAASRTDVSDVVTVAGNPDIVAWAAHHGVTPLAGSLNPADRAKELSAIPQTHYAGRADQICPPWLCERYLERLGRPSAARCVTVDGANHRQGFEERWPELLAAHRKGLPAR